MPANAPTVRSLRLLTRSQNIAQAIKWRAHPKLLARLAAMGAA